MVDERDNPYAPPVETPEHQEPPPERGTLNLSAHGWEVVSSMSKWMRIVSVMLYVFAGLITVALLIGFGVLGAKGLPSGAIGVGAKTAMALSGVLAAVYVVLMFFAATWLRRAAVHFYQGMTSDSESPLARGFRNLRLFLILYGIYAIIGLIGAVAQLALVR